MSALGHKQTNRHERVFPSTGEDGPHRRALAICSAGAPIFGAPAWSTSRCRAQSFGLWL